MGLIVILSILSSIAVGELFVLAVLHAHTESAKQARERYTHTQLRLIRRFYPELTDLTYCEIVELYDIHALYNGIGSHRSTLSAIKDHFRH